MPNPWWIAICAGLLSGTFSAIVTFTLNHNRDSNDHRREKAEDFYIALDKYVALLKISFLHDIAGKGSSALPLSETEAKEMSAAYTTIVMSSSIHFTALSQRVSTLFSARDNLSIEIAKGRSTKIQLNAIKDALKNLESCADELKMQIARAARHGAPLTLIEAGSQLLGFGK